jgi:hypothetical protein
MSKASNACSRRIPIDRVIVSDARILGKLFGAAFVYIGFDLDLDGSLAKRRSDSHRRAGIL